MPRWVDQLEAMEPMEPEDALRELLHVSMRSASELLKLEMDAAKGQFVPVNPVPLVLSEPTEDSPPGTLWAARDSGRVYAKDDGGLWVLMYEPERIRDYDMNCDICPGCGMTGMAALERGHCHCHDPLPPARVRQYPAANGFNIMTAWENL